MYGFQPAARRPAQQPEKTQRFASGGMVRGPGTGTSDSIEAEVEPGTFIMPADSTQAIGPDALAGMGKVPVRLSDGEFEVPPEQAMALGIAVLKAMKDATHAPVNGQDGGQTDEEVAQAKGFAPAAARATRAPVARLFADGGAVGIPTRPNSFGDASAAAADPSVTRVNTGGSDTFGRAAATPASASSPSSAPVAAPTPSSAAAGFQPASARMNALSDPRSSTYDPNPNASSNASMLANYASSIGTRGLVEQGMTQTPAPATARNSFGDAAAAMLDPTVTQVATGFRPASQRTAPMSMTAGVGGFQPRSYADGGVVQDDKQQQPSAVTVPATSGPLSRAASISPATPAPLPASNAVGFSPAAIPSSSPVAASAPPPPTTSEVTRNGNSYSATGSVGGNVSINGEAPKGTVSTLPPGASVGFGFGSSSAGAALTGSGMGGTPSEQNAAAADNLAARGQLESMGRLLASGQIQAPQAGPSLILPGSTGFRRDSRFLAQELGNQRALEYATGNDPASRQRNALLERSRLEQQSALMRQSLSDRNDLNRTLITERGNNARAGITAQAGIEEARIKAANDNKPPAGYRWVGGGRLEPIPGGPAGDGKPLTEDQAKSAGYALRMDNALKLIGEIGKENPGALRPGAIEAATNTLPEALANTLRPEARQRVEAAQLDALDAALTLNTGAAYTREQLQGLSRSYFAQPGDDDKTVADKANRLQSLIDTARLRAGDKGSAMTDAAQAKNAARAGGAPVAATANVPAGMSRQVGTSGGRPVYEDAQGNRFIGG